MRRLASALASVLALCALATLSGCATTTTFEAAGDVHAFLLSIRDGDQRAFDAHVDRAALKTQLRARIMAQAAKRQDAAGGAAVMGVLLGGKLADMLFDRLIQPDVFRAVAEYLGYSPQTPIPGRLEISEALRTSDYADVCAAKTRTSPCILTFRNEDGVWKLVGFDGDIGMLLPKT